MVVNFPGSLIKEIFTALFGFGPSDARLTLAQPNNGRSRLTHFADVSGTLFGVLD